MPNARFHTTHVTGRSQGRRLIAWLTVGAAAALIYAGLHSPLFLVRQLDVRGLVQLTPAEVRLAAGIPDGAYLWEIRSWNLRSRLELLPLVQQASVRLHWPNRLEIDIVERQPVCLVRYQQSSGLELDAAGRIIALVPLSRPPVSLPVVTGLTLPRAEVGQRLTSLAASRALQVVQGLGAEGAAVVSEVHVEPDSSITVLLKSGLAARFGDGSDARRKTEELLGLLQVIQKQHLAVDHIDLESAETPSLKLKG